MSEIKTRFIVVAGGVISGVGKGVATASIGKILKEHGYKTTLIKVDPYINCDAGTLRPTEHGEVWVTHDGGEIDQDLGTYERFLNEDLPKRNSITTGQIYKSVIEKERAGSYLGETVQFIPHILDEILLRIKQASAGYDIAVIEIGGTVGDYENTPFLFAFKSLIRELGSSYVASMLVTYLPVPAHIGEMKTKPTQQALAMLSQQGILADFIICRSHQTIDDVRKKKIEIAANIARENIIVAQDLTSVYEMPLEFVRQQLGEKLLAHFGLPSKKEPDWKGWKKRVDAIQLSTQKIKIAVVGKYLETGSYSLTDSYLSICHALTHAAAEIGMQVELEWINAKKLELSDDACESLANFDGILVPGGFGCEGVEGKMRAINYARTHDIPYLGICYGFQLAAVEYARNVCKLSGAHTTEVDPNTPHPIIMTLPVQGALLAEQKYGGTMRLGAYSAEVTKGSLVERLYQEVPDRSMKDNAVTSNCIISERHRHRYEVNPAYVDILTKAGFIFSAQHTRADGTQLMECAELPSHPFFVATQAHPEFTSRLTSPNPLFYGFVQACVKRSSGYSFVGKQDGAQVG